ncbi:MAG: hypothetical protein ACYSQZ_07240, partial [Planctomycetota bacterium]
PKHGPDAAASQHPIGGDGKATQKTSPAQQQQPPLTQKADGDITKSPAPVKAKPVTPVPPIKKGKYKLSAPIPGVSDSKRKTQLALVPVLFIILVLISVYGTGTTTQIADKNPQAEVKTKEISPDNSAVKIDWQIPAPYSARLVDPMVPDRPKNIGGIKVTEEHITEEGAAYDSEGTIQESIVINSILHSALESSIVIGDDILYEGDTISGVTIIKINKDNVLFEKEGKQFTVYWQR